MGGTDPENMLNALGRETLADGSVRGGNILLWKRKAEKYLASFRIRRSAGLFPRGSNFYSLGLVRAL